MRQLVDVIFTSAAVISIHAPVKGATHDGPVERTVTDISIHAPVKGATCNSTYTVQLPGIISIHAPVKGATTGLFLL